jgi:hypothetical protein
MKTIIEGKKCGKAENYIRTNTLSFLILVHFLVCIRCKPSLHGLQFTHSVLKMDVSKNPRCKNAFKSRAK